MRISIVHGEDTLKAYNRFRELVDGAQKKGFEIVEIKDIKNVVSQSLFEDKQVFTLAKANKINLKDWKWLSANAPKYNSNLLIYYEGNASVTIIKNLTKDAKVEKFDLPKIIFQFLDSFYPKNSQNSLRVLNNLVMAEPIELVLHLLARNLRDLYWAKMDDTSMPIPDWRVLKLKKQSDRFPEGNLEKIINELAQIDVKSKTTDSDLKNLLDILIVSNL